MLAPERWLPVPGHAGYEVSDQGRIRSYRNRQGHAITEPRLMTPTIVNGYLWIKLGRRFQCGLHRLVIQAFRGPTPEGMECRHLDGNRMNAKLDNLAYGTRSENYADRHRHGTENDGERHGLAKLTNEQARQIRSSGLTTKEVAAQYGLSIPSAYRVRTGRTYRTA